MKIPAGASFVLERLNRAGYQAYVVGGCVRDTLLGISPKDWDVCTNALPEEMQRVFADCHVIETGLKHGTLTVMVDHEPYEVTTFRVDGAYTDHRHPDEVIFVTDVREDLSRRDLTINAMAWSPQTGLVDAFGGQRDLQSGMIRAVGDPQKRFTEDALRILRTMRFASVYGFTVEAETARAAHELAPTLKNVAAERIRVELAKLLCGKEAAAILRDFADVLFVILPELQPMHGFCQHTPYHAYDVWEHTLHALMLAPPTETLRLAALLHDSGKPACFTLDAQGIGHMHGHAKVSREIAERILMALRVDNATRDRVLLLVENHHPDIEPNRVFIRRRLSRFGEDALRELLLLQRADDAGKGTADASGPEEAYQRNLAVLEELLRENACFTLKDLAVSGKDLLAAGVPKGRTVGACLTYILEEVLSEHLPNEWETLLHAAMAWLASGRNEA